MRKDIIDNEQEEKEDTSWLLREKWVAESGSIFTEKEFRIQNKCRRVKVFARRSIAFNIGQNIAEYIVSVHNEELKNTLDAEEEERLQKEFENLPKVSNDEKFFASLAGFSMFVFGILYAVFFSTMLVIGNPAEGTANFAMAVCSAFMVTIGFMQIFYHNAIEEGMFGERNYRRWIV